MHRSEIAAFLNQKGGVGKTTSVVNVSSGLTILGKKVLIVDLTPVPARVSPKQVLVLGVKLLQDTKCGRCCDHTTQLEGNNVFTVDVHDAR